MITYVVIVKTFGPWYPSNKHFINGPKVDATGETGYDFSLAKEYH